MGIHFPEPPYDNDGLPNPSLLLPPDSDDEDDSDGNDEEYVAPPEPAPRLLGPAGPSPARTSRAESTVGLEDLSEFLRTCCKAQQTGNMTLHRVLWYTYLAWRQKIGSQRPSVSSGGVGLSQCMQRLGHRERLFTREIQVRLCTALSLICSGPREEPRTWRVY
jgi:hypothetical protein